MIYAFEEFELNTDSRELRCAKGVRAVEPQVLALLELLITHSNRMVSKDEIVERIWNGRIVSDGSINSRVKLLRKALDDDGKQQRLIKTLHGQGFRFVGNVQNQMNDTAPPTGEAVSVKTEKRPEPARVQKPLNSIAVLPFDNMSNDPNQDHLADGLVEDIITVLSKIPRLHVTARNSTFVYKGQAVNIRKIGKDLGVATILEGSVRASAGKLRITAQLIDVASGKHIWAERYDRQKQEIFALQDEMTQQIVSALQIQLVDGEQARLWASGTTNFKAWENAVLAYSRLARQTYPDLLVARGLLEEALDHDDTYATAYVLLARTYFFEAYNGWSESPETSLAQSYQASEKALSINETEPQALAQKAAILVVMGQYATAETLAEKAVSFGPYHSQTLTMAAMVMGYCNRVDLAEKYAKTAIKVNPMGRSEPAIVLGFIYLGLERYEDALDQAQAIIKSDPQNIDAHILIVAACGVLGQEQRARDAASQVLKIDPDFSILKYSETRKFSQRDGYQKVETVLMQSGLLR